MTRRTLFAAALILSAAATSALAADGVFDKTLSVNGAPTVALSTGSGYIRVTPGTDNQIHVIGHVHASWPSADDQVRQIVANPPIVQSGNTITIGAAHSEDLFHNVSIDYDVTTPRSSAVSAHSGSGSIQIAGVKTVDSVQTGSGSIQVSLSAPGGIRADTGSGSIHIDGLVGALKARTGSGTIQVAGNPTADWQLSTGSGSIHLKLPDNARFSLTATTGSGTVHIDQPIVMQGSFNRHQVSGTVNGGGPAIHASTGSGDITINGNFTAAAQLQDNNSLHVPGATDCVDNPGQPACHKN